MLRLVERKRGREGGKGACETGRERKRRENRRHKRHEEERQVVLEAYMWKCNVFHHFFVLLSITLTYAAFFFIAHVRLYIGFYLKFLSLPRNWCWSFQFLVFSFYFSPLLHLYLLFSLIFLVHRHISLFLLLFFFFFLVFARQFIPITPASPGRSCRIRACEEDERRWHAVD